MTTPDNVQIKEERTPPAMDDPMEWTIHEVIPWLNNFSFGKELETTFRANDVDGHVLLNHFTHDTLKSELDIQSFGRRIHLLNGIKLLQGHSAKYQLANHEEKLLYYQSPHLKSHTPSRVSSSENLAGLSPLSKFEINKDSAAMLFKQLRLEDNEMADQSVVDATAVDTTPQPDKDTPMIDEDTEEGDLEDDKSSGSDDKSLGDNDSEAEPDVEEENAGEEGLNKAIGDQIRALVGLSSAIPRRNPLPTPFTPPAASQKASPINILQPRRKGESLPVIARAIPVAQPINILQPRRKGEPRPIGTEASVTLATAPLPNVTPPSHVPTPSPIPTTTLPSRTITPTTMAPLQAPTPVSNFLSKKSPRRLWSKQYLPSRAVSESALFFATNSADEFGAPDPLDDLSANRTTMIVWRGSKFHTDRVAYLGEYRVEQRRMMGFLRRPWPLVEVKEGEETALVYKPLRTHAEKEQARKRRRVDPDVIRVGLAKERTWDGGWRRVEDDVLVVVLRVRRTEGGEEVTTIQTTWNKVKPHEISQLDRAVEAEPEEELQSTSNLLFTDGMLEDLQKRWMRPGAGDEYAEEAGLKPDAEGFLKPLDDSDESDFEAAISQDFLRELEAEDNLQRRANMSPEERMQEKERLAKAAGKPELTKDEIEAEINLYIREFDDNWKKTKASKIERDKYKVWNRNQGKLKAIETELEHLKNERLPKLVNQLLMNHYFTTKEARSMCNGGLYETLALRCELEWKVSVLRGEKPDKPPPWEKIKDNNIDRKGKKKATTDDRKAKYSGESEHDENDYTSESSMADFIDDSEMVIEEDVKAVSTGEAESLDEIHDQVELVTLKPSPRKRVKPSWNKEQLAKLREKKAKEAATQGAEVVTNNESDERIKGQESPVVEKETDGIVAGSDYEDMERADTDVDMSDVQDLLDYVTREKKNGLSGLEVMESVSSVKSAETMDNNMKTPVSAAPLSSAKSESPLIADGVEDDANVVFDLVSPRQKLLAEKQTPAEKKYSRASLRGVATSEKRLWKKFQGVDWKPDDSTDDDEIIISDTDKTLTPQSLSPSSPVMTNQDAVPTPVSSLSSSHLGTDRRPIPLDSEDEWDERPATKVPRIDGNDSSSPIALKVKQLIESKPSKELYHLIIVLMKRLANNQQSSPYSKDKVIRYLFNMFRLWTTKRSAKENQAPKHKKISVSEMFSQQRFHVFYIRCKQHYAREANKLQNQPNVSTLSKKKRKLVRRSDFDRGSGFEMTVSEEEDDGKRTDKKHWWSHINNVRKRPALDPEEEDGILVLTDDESFYQRKKNSKRDDSENDFMDEDDLTRDADSSRGTGSKSRSLKDKPRKPKRIGFRRVHPEKETVTEMWKETTEKNKEVAIRAQVQKAQRSWDEKDHVVINIGHAESEDDIKIIPELGSILKEHQKDGVQFLWKQIVMFREYGCILAHNMGLGKTLQVIVFIFTLMREIDNKNPAIPSNLEPGRTLILAPASVTQNWCNEIDQWISSEYLDVIKDVYHLSSKKSNLALSDKLQVLEKWYNYGGIFVISYETFRDLVINRGARQSDAHKEQIERCLVAGPSLVIADEGHRIKNPQSSLFLTLKKFKTLSRVCLTGYPLQNNLVEYWTMIDWVRPGYLGDISSFRNRYKNPIENVFSDSTPSEVKISMKQLFILKSAIGDLIQRKDASTLHRELKKKTEFVLATRLTNLQHRMTHEYVEMSQNNSENTSNFLLKAIHLRSIANHPYVFKTYITTEKQRKAKNVAVISTNGNGESAIDPVDIDADGDDVALATVLGDDSMDLQSWMQNVCVDVQDLAWAGYSNKVPIVMRIIEHSKRIKDKVLLFSHQIPLLDYIQELLIKHGISSMRLDGSIAQQKRQGLIDRFNKSAQDVFLISAKAGSLGVNLVAANRVILLDVDWNPCHDDQAIARAYRYGQSKQVYVYRFQSYSSIEERIFQNNVQKMGLSSRVIDDKQKQREFTRAEISRYLRFPDENPQSRLGNLDENTKKEIAMDPIMKDIVEQNADKIVDIRLVNSYLLDLVDKDEALTQQEIEECQQEALKYKQGGLAAGNVVQTMIEDLGAGVATSSAPEMPLQILIESVAPELRPTIL